MTRHDRLVAALFVGVVLAFCVPLLLFCSQPEPIRIEPEVPDATPVIRASDHRTIYNPIEDG